MIVLKRSSFVLLFSILTQYTVAALESNGKGSPQVLSDKPNSNACNGPGRTRKCTVELDVPSNCVSNGESVCPIVFYLHGAGGRIDGYKRGSDVHTHGFIGVYPQGERGWNTGPKSSNNCDYTDYDCTSDPNEGEFIATIISEVQALGANGSIYLIGSSNGAALAHRTAVNAGTQLPIKGIVTTVTQLLDSPDRSGPGPLNYNNPSALSNQGPKVSVLNFMGTGDGLIPYNGGSSPVFGGNNEFQLMSALDSMEAWASHNGCSLAPRSKAVRTDRRAGGDGTGVFYQWENCSGGTFVEHYAINGGGHGSGGSLIDDVKISYDISADFIKRCEDSEASPTVSPKPTPQPVPTTRPPTRAPSPPSVGCSDDPDWVGKHNDDHTCDFVSRDPEVRCRWVNKQGVPAMEACRVSCDNCVGCSDDPDWVGKHNDDHTCDFVSRDPEVRCRWVNKQGVPAMEACRVSCDNCVGCSDDPDWVGKFNDDHTCEFVSGDPETRCRWVNKQGVPAMEACRVSCNNCGDDEKPTSSPTKSPSHSPSSASDCPQGEAMFLIELKADKKTKSQNFYLVQEKVTNGNNKKWKKVMKRNKIPNNALHEFDMCLDSSSCYRFRIKDKKKDGLCCKDGDGYYKIHYENEELRHKPFDEDFGKKFQSIEFGNC